jgi:hypothetical protein
MVWIQSLRVRFPRSLLPRELFLDLLESVIPECIYPISSNIPKPMKCMLATLCSKPAALIASSSRVIQSSGEPVDGVALIVQKLNI